MKKHIAWYITIVMMVSLLAGCSSATAETTAGTSAATAGEGTTAAATQASSTAAGEDVTIKWGVYETDNLTAEYYAKIIADFEADNPGIKVERVIATGDDRGSFWKTMYASGSFPDVVMEAEILATTDGIFAEVPEDLLANFDSAALCTYNGKTTTIPAMKQLRMQCYYNIADFEALGLKEPKTWDEFLAVCETIKAAGKTPLICGGTGDIWATGQPWWISVTNQSIMNAYPNFNEDIVAGNVKWNNDALVKSLTVWQDMIKSGYYHKGCMSFSYSQAAAEFQNGGSVMMIDGSWAAAGFDGANNTDFGVFAVPNPEGLDAYCTAVSYWGVAEQSENKEAAFKFVQYVLGGNQETYKYFLSADGLSSTTKTPVTYDQGPLMNKFVSNWAKSTLVPEITKVPGDYAMPNGFEAYICKSLQNIFTGSDVASELKAWDEEYAMLKE